MNYPKRKRPAQVDYETRDVPLIIFVTVCTAGRARWLASAESHNALLAAWSQADHWVVGRYIIMPDHVHLFASPTGESSLERWIGYWKRLFWSGRRRRPGEKWLAGHWDTRMRNFEHYDAQLQYVLDNPLRHGLVRNPNDWPFHGEVTPLDW